MPQPCATIAVLQDEKGVPYTTMLMPLAWLAHPAGHELMIPGAHGMFMPVGHVGAASVETPDGSVEGFAVAFRRVRKIALVGLDETFERLVPVDEAKVPKAK
jgi:hypothetical protein